MSAGVATVSTTSVEQSIQALTGELAKKSNSSRLAQQVHECIPLILSLTLLFCDKKDKYKYLYNLIYNQEELFIVQEERAELDVQIEGKREDGTAILRMTGFVVPRYYSTDGRVVCTRRDDHHGVLAVYIEYIILKGLVNLASRVTRVEGTSDAQYTVALFSLFHADIIRFFKEYAQRPQEDFPSYCQRWVDDIFHKLFPGGREDWDLPVLLRLSGFDLYQQIVQEVVPDILVQALGTFQKMFAVIPLKGERDYDDGLELAQFAQGLAEGAVRLSPQLVTKDPWVAVQGYDWEFLNDFLREVVKDKEDTQFKGLLVQFIKRGLFSVLSTVSGLGVQLTDQADKERASETLFSLITKGVLTEQTLEPLFTRLKGEQEKASADGLEATMMNWIITLLEKRVLGLVKSIESTLSSLRNRTGSAYQKLLEEHPLTAGMVMPFIKQVAGKVSTLLTPKLEKLLKDENTRNQVINEYLTGCTPDTVKKLSQFIGEIINSSNFQQILCEQLEYIIIHILLELWKKPREKTAHPAKTLLEKWSEIFLKYLPKLQEVFIAVKGKNEEQITLRFDPIIRVLCNDLGVTENLFNIEREGDAELTKKIGTLLYSLVIRQGALQFAYQYMEDMATPLDRAEKLLGEQLCHNKTLQGNDEKSGLQRTARGVVDHTMNVVFQQEMTVNRVVCRALDVHGETEQLQQAADFLSQGGVQQFCRDPHQRLLIEKMDQYVFRLLNLVSSRFLREAPHLGQRVASLKSDHTGKIEIMETRVKEPEAYFQIITFIFHKVVRGWIFASPRPASKDETVFYKDVANRVWAKVANKHPDDLFAFPLSNEWQSIVKTAWDEEGPQLIKSMIQPYIDPVGRIKLMLNGIRSIAELPDDRDIAHLSSSSKDVAGAKKLLKRQMRKAIRAIIMNYIREQYKQLNQSFELWIADNPRLEILGKVKKIIVDILFVYIYRYFFVYVIRYIVLPLLQLILLPVTLIEGYVLGKLVDWISGEEWERAYQDVILSLFDDIICSDFSAKWKEMANGEGASDIFKRDFDDAVTYFIDHQMRGAVAWPIKYGLQQILRHVEVIPKVKRTVHGKSPLEDIVEKLNRVFV